MRFDTFTRLPSFAVGMAAAWLPARVWPRLPLWVPVRSAAFVSGLVTLLAGAAIGIPGFLAHAGATTSLANDAMLHETFHNPNAGFNRGMVQGFAGLSIFTFLLLTPAGWATMYLMGSGTLRAAAAWFDDVTGDPILTGVDKLIVGTTERRRAAAAARARAAEEGPEVPDRVVTAAAAGLPPCDHVIVAARRKPGWERGTTVFTPDAAFRIGEVVERTVAGRLRTLYPLTLHADFEAIRKSVHYEFPAAAGAARAAGTTTEPE